MSVSVCTVVSAAVCRAVACRVWLWEWVCWPLSAVSEGARLRVRRAAQQPVVWSKRYDPLLRHGVEGAGGLGSLGYQTGTSEPPPAEHGPATCPEWLSSKQAEGAAKV